MAAIEQRMTTAFGLGGQGGLRHASPWSVDTRIPDRPAAAGSRS
jgi:hypothetical protein